MTGRLLVVVASIAAVLTPGAAQAVGTVSQALTPGRVVINGFDSESAPFASLDETDTPTGFDIEALNRIAELEGFQISHQSVVFDELIDTLQGKYAADGESIDLIDSGFTITPDREAQVAFTFPYLEIQKVLLVASDSTETPEQILLGGSGGAQIVAVRDGSTESEWIASHFANATLVYYDGYDEAVDDLLDGTVSAIAMDELTANHLVESDGFKIAGTIGMPPAQVAFAVRKNDSQLLNSLNEGLLQLMASPEWDQLKARYQIP